MLDHLRLTVADVAAAYRLYDPVLRALGFQEVEREDDGVFRDPDGFKLEVVTRASPPSSPGR